MDILIFANGNLGKNSDLTQLMNQADMIIAADGGANHCNNLGVRPDLIIGDLDSIDPAVLSQYENSNTPIQRHPEKKDATDLELALDFATAQGAKKINICGALGGRWDMSIANIQLCASEKYKKSLLSLLGDDCTIEILHSGSPHTIHGGIGRKVSLIPLKKEVSGITLKGFEYPLINSTITFGSSHGVSNVIEAEPATISLKSGTLLCIQLLSHEA